MWFLSRTLRLSRRATTATTAATVLSSQRWLHTPAVSAESNAAVPPSSNRAAPCATISFQLDTLPPQLQREFDTAANQRALRYLVRHRARQTMHTTAAEADDKKTAPAEITISPSSVDKVVWRCDTCGTQWSARPADRTNAQIRDAYRCPSCYGDAPHAASATVESPQQPSKSQRPETKKPSTPVSSLLCEAHPPLAAQWDTQRNAHLQNQVLQDVTEVHTTASTKAWWRCPLCRTPWLESVTSRVARYEVALQSTAQRNVRAAAASGSSKTPAVAALLCPACERRGAGGIHAHKNAAEVQRENTPRRFLCDDRHLLAEALLTPSQNPQEISLTSESMLRWRCRTCQTEFSATVANRFLRHERCPQCSGREQSTLNLLVIQRPDVVAEVSKHISRTRLRHITVHDDVELPFVCQTCFSPYRMTARSRCAVPRGVPACSKCFLTGTQVLAQAQQQMQRSGATQLTARARHRVRQKTLQLNRSNRSADRLAATANELNHRDGAIKD